MRVAVDSSLPLAAEPGSGHNRWHPDIPPLVRIAPGELLTIETRDGLDRALRPGATAEDVLAIDLAYPHPLTGPVWVEGAEPGDTLVVELLSFEPDDWGVTCIVPGFGYLADVFSEPFVVNWELRDGHARSAELPGVAIPEDTFPGVIGVAPSHELDGADPRARGRAPKPGRGGRRRRAARRDPRRRRRRPAHDPAPRDRR
ncbi:MAG: acetamidase/formamidase family protein [Gaiellales bacterium]